MQTSIKILKKWLNESKRVVIFTGAGMSVPSGIPDFRSSNGIYSSYFQKNISPETIISHSFFLKYPETFYDFYFAKMVYLDAKPNLAHRFFADLQKDKEVSIVTQNIDGLDKMAGSKEVFEIHGTIWENYCVKCHKFYPLGQLTKDRVPYCSCGGIIKPNVVLYEENLDVKLIEGAIEKISQADILLVIGTSLVVYPAASFLQYYRGNKLVIINKTPTNGDSIADLVINADIIQVVKELIELEKK